MSGRAHVDYKEAERRFVIEEQSVRQIASDMGLKSWSSMAAIARRDDWVGKRQAYRNSIARRSYETSAAAVGEEKGQVVQEAILAGRATLRRYLQQLADTSSPMHISAKDAQVWAAFLVAELAGDLSGGSTEVPDHARNVTPPDADLLRRVVEAARGQVAPAGSVGPAPLVIAPDPRPN